MRATRLLIALVAMSIGLGSLPARADIGGGTVTFDLQASGQIPCPGTCNGTLSGSSSGSLAGLDGTEDWQLIFKDATLTGTWNYTEDCDPVLPSNSGSGTVTISGGMLHGRHGSHNITAFTLTINYSYTRENISLVVTGTASLSITETAPATRIVISSHQIVGNGTLIPQLPDYCKSPLRVVGTIAVLPA